MAFNKENENIDVDEVSKESINVHNEVIINVNNEVSTNDKAKKKSKVRNEFLEWTLIILIAVAIAISIRFVIFEPVKVDGPSMENTLFTDQKLIVYKLGYFFTKPKRGDIVVLKIEKGTFEYIPFYNSGEVDYIKRIIGVPGDTIDIKDGNVFVNGKKLVEPYVNGETVNNDQVLKVPLVVPENKVLVLGDNRPVSKDSRVFGFKDISDIKGKAVFRFWPLSDFGVLK